MNRPLRFALLLALAGSVASPALAYRDHDNSDSWRKGSARQEEPREHRRDRHRHEGHRRNDDRDGKKHRHESHRRDRDWDDKRWKHKHKPRDKDDEDGDHQGRREGRHEGGGREWRDCPPGLVEIGRSCVPPGQVRKAERRHYPRIGEAFRPGDYRRINDPGLYALEPRDDWDYYRDDSQIYRVDNRTQTVLTVLQLMQAFSQ